MADFGINPTNVSFASPPLKIKMLGKLEIWYSVAVFKFSSVFIFTTFILSFNSSATSSKIGPIFLHGPHQGAQKSTTVRVSEFKTSFSNEASVISIALKKE